MIHKYFIVELTLVVGILLCAYSCAQKMYSGNVFYEKSVKPGLILK